MTRARLLVISLLLSACGGASRSAEPPSKGPDVLIPEVTDDQSKTARDEPTPATGARQNPVVPEEPVGPEPGSSDDMWGSFGGPGAARGGADCDRAADCCLKFYQKSGGDPSVHRICGSMRIAPSSLCAQLLSSFQSTAPGIGVQCP
ncbi:MAG: hypothetical protein L6Q84_18300 [Polyangiaceae bacterium]|nr:hypothetical protein [Polyangiaceae bacterium]